MPYDAMILAPNFEPATALWYPWLTQELSAKLQQKGLDVVVLAGSAVVRDNVWSQIQSFQPRLILGVGHGNEDVYTGQNYDIIFQKCSYDPALIASRNFAPVSCLVGINLLPDMQTKGLGAGLGEDVDYAFWYSNPSDPLHDPILALFTQSEFSYSYALAEGKTHDQSHQVMYDAYYAAARQAQPHIADTLKTDANHRIAFGNPDWTIGEGQPPQPPSGPKIVMDGYLAIGPKLKLPIHLEGTIEE